MKNKLTHFAIYTEDMDRAKKFYGALFGWQFSSYGPADFIQIQTEGAELIGALQSKKYAPIEEKVNGFECSIEVGNIDGAIQVITANGGKIVMPKTAIPDVGWLTKFLDTEENLVCAIQYDSSAN